MGIKLDDYFKGRFEAEVAKIGKVVSGEDGLIPIE